MAATSTMPSKVPVADQFPDETLIFSIIYYFNTGLGITAGYHRLWSHRAYKATLPLKIYLAAVGAGAVEGSIRWWSKEHRIHHRYTDTTKDPYSATFCVNSLAHWLGDQPFDDRNSPRNHALTALVTLGEGYHNFHHEFPSDYRNAIQWWQYDPTKWCIWMWKQLGLAYDLKQFRQNEIEKGQLQQMQKKLDKKRATLDWGTPLEELPVLDWDDFVRETQKGRCLVAVAGVVHDVSNFIEEHPGGKALISSAIGKDATAIFNGGVYEHSNAAHNTLSTMRVAVLRGGCEVEIWKKSEKGTKEKLATSNDRAD